MRAPIRLVRGGWWPLVERCLARFVREDPRALVADDAAPDAYRGVMSSIYIGDTIKITGANRHPRADALLLDNVDLAGRTIVDIGASDGSTCVDLIRKIPDFASYVIADLYIEVEQLTANRHLFVYDLQGNCVLVGGRRLVAWPGLSRAVRLIYRPLLSSAERRRAERRPLLLLNPLARRLIAEDPRVTYRTHDVFDVWPEGRPDVIKVANLLRRLYFDDPAIRRALVALHASLAEGGHLLVVDNPRIAGIAERGGLYRRVDDGFAAVTETEEGPEIADLVLSIRTAAAR